jgi:hypothetical protein
LDECARLEVPMSRSFYCHWLDPEYLAIRGARKSVLDQRRQEIVGLLKMKAIFGDRVYLSDVQLNDSRVIFEMFVDKGFRAFLREHHDFLHLEAVPAKELSAAPEQLAVVGAALVRTLWKGSGWGSSTYGSPERTQSIAKAYLTIKSQSDLEGLLRPRGSLGKLRHACSSSGRQEDKLVVGMLNAIEHFASPLGSWGASHQLPKSYYEILEETAERLSSNDTRRKHVESALRFTKDMQQGTPKNRRGRSMALAKLEQDGLTSPEARRSYLLIIHAWNIGVSVSVGAEQDDALGFLDFEPFYDLYGETKEQTVVGLSDWELFEYVRRESAVDWHPALVTWPSIAEIRRKCQIEILKYQDSIRDRVNDEDAFRDVVRCASRIITENGEGPSSKLAHGIKKTPAYRFWLQIDPKWRKGAGYVFGLPKYGMLAAAGEKSGSLAAAAAASVEVAEKVVPKVRRSIAGARTEEALQAHALRYCFRRFSR